ncbi:hypothetical protein FEM48_Zijuj02G0130400 [Ziziphus jujuba var. spinosa]|uniref:Homeobox protein knotted-1-like 1 n=1 Tax=Ziziphus jujuba var. spinosa TaxID=714518 RepID=A0A978VVW1_ZIZJJ|nr:hypothetical protein FEM48_Zijuj02G0130400 [Ziziphus jujuba var. spinosa]
MDRSPNLRVPLEPVPEKSNKLPNSHKRESLSNSNSHIPDVHSGIVEVLRATLNVTEERPISLQSKEQESSDKISSCLKVGSLMRQEGKGTKSIGVGQKRKVRPYGSSVDEAHQTKMPTNIDLGPTEESNDPKPSQEDLQAHKSSFLDQSRRLEKVRPLGGSQPTGDLCKEENTLENQVLPSYSSPKIRLKKRARGLSQVTISDFLNEGTLEDSLVGAPPETATLLEEISRENHPLSCCSEIGVDPELDEFMESYCEILHRYKEELSKPFNEATTFLCSIESQLSNLCKGTLARTHDHRSVCHICVYTLLITDNDQGIAGGTSEEELSNCGDQVEAAESEETSGAGGRAIDQELKDMLLQKYSGYLSSLRKEFLKKRKKGKLPKDARTALLDWWNTHYRWPYPTEEEKAKLSEMTGLDQKQINNWFINQRKRHWKPTEEMRFALMEGQ